MITKDKITEIFCLADDFCKEFDVEIEKLALQEPDGIKHRKRKWWMSRAEIMTILICFHFNDFRNFKHYYLFYVREHMKDLFPQQLSYNRFIELESRVAVEMMLFLQVCCLGRCTGISFIDSTSIPVCHNKRIRRNRVFKEYASIGKARWDGISASSCTWLATSVESWSTSCSPRRMWMKGTQECSTGSATTSSASCLLIRGIYPKGLSKDYTMTALTLSRGWGVTWITSWYPCMTKYYSERDRA